MAISDSLYRFLLSSGIMVGGTGLAWMLMKVIVPTKEDMLKKLPDEATSPEALATQDRINEQFFMVLKENMNSSNPAWKVMGLKEVQERQQKRKDQQQKKEAKLKEKQSNEFTTE
ncbi:uncharacterized protein [Pocillopora verrucosa]|uniref:Ubiquinol-cytochrome-c reductase complex assembly factor 3 n=1 Tax=Pocillopora damicornis TaxID=46731 RepID=A0A3M6U8P6_POCDA|nr:uncharacterized protein LOC113667260 [Pocillopora damicornis]XP_058946985.1 uncharacterized protein LOC131774905 [Pocillopora verrucosa]RMX50050.1 hypothetical protein pdam_00002857 [Pocillopora damicornis]